MPSDKLQAVINAGQKAEESLDVVKTATNAFEAANIALQSAADAMTAAKTELDTAFADFKASL